MIFSLILLAIAAAIAAVVWRAVTRRRASAVAHHPPSLRAVFTYLLLFVGVIVSAMGAAGLTGQLLDRLGNSALVAGSAEAARNVAFLVVGVPLATGLGLRVRTLLRTDPAERTSFAWSVYVGLASTVSLVVAMIAIHDSLVWAFGVGPRDPYAVGQAIVWSLVWLVHARLDRVLTPAAGARAHLLAGSAIGLATTAVGLVGVVGNSLDITLGLQLDEFVEPRDQLRRALATLLVGAAAWTVSWWFGAARGTPDLLGNAYALVAGTFAGTVTAVIGATWVLTDVLVWFVGSPETSQASDHFRVTPHAGTAALVGVLLWWYHTGLLGRPGPTAVSGRSELHRVRDYGAAVIGMIAAAVGGVLLVAALVESVTRSVAIAGASTANLALVGVVLVVLGLPIWWAAWRSTRSACHADPGAERASTTRRVYLVGLTGVGVLVGVGALVGVVYLLFRDLFEGTVSAETVRSMRYPLGILVVAAAIAGGHATLTRSERALRPAAERRARFVVLAGPQDPALGRQVAHATGARVLSWPRTDGVDPPWSAEEVVRLVAASAGPDVVVVQGPSGLIAVPVDRSHGDVAAATVAHPHPADVTRS